MMPRRRLHTSTSRLRRSGLLAVALLIWQLTPSQVEAHERWFTPRGPYWDPEWDRLWSLPVLLAIVASVVTVSILGLAQRKLNDPLWPRPPFLQRLELSAPAILGVQAAITLIYSASQLTLFVPNIELPHNVFGVLVAGLAIVAGFSFITGVLPRVGALLVLFLFGLAFVFGTWYEALEQVLFIGIAIYLLAVGRGVVRYQNGYEEDRTPLSDAIRPYALPALRVLAAISIIIVGFTEKLLAPHLGVAFLQEYPDFNVARLIGLDWFTDERFVYAAGIVETTAGFALLSGKLVRVVILALWIPFNLGIAFLPPIELIGHLPILATMYVLLVRGTEGIPPLGVQTASGELREQASRATSTVPQETPVNEPAPTRFALSAPHSPR